MLRYIISFVMASTSSAALAEVPRVVTDIAPIYGLVSQVMGDLGQPQLLLEPGADAHDFQLRPSQSAALAQADLLIWVGPELTPWLDRAASGLAENATQLQLLDLEGTFQLSYEEKDQLGHNHYEGDDHDHEGVNPHAWLDPHNAQVWLGAIASALAEKDPEHAASYLNNATSAAERIAAFDAQLKPRMAALADKSFFVFHDAYAYFSREYDLTIAGSVTLGDAAPPGAGHLRHLQNTARDAHVLCVFPEANHDSDLIASVIENTDIRIGKPLDPEGATLPISPNVWTDIMENLADSLEDCLS